jgi:hypothetical protein
MRDSEHPDLFPMQERNAVDVYAHRVARNSVLSDMAAVAAAEALSGMTAGPRPELPNATEAVSAVSLRADRGGEEQDADHDQGTEQQDGSVPGEQAP